MSTANFCSMTDKWNSDMPLICGCMDCDEPCFGFGYCYPGLEDELHYLNEELEFYKIDIEPGHYVGFQLYVDLEYEPDPDEEEEELAKKEHDKILEHLLSLKDKPGFMELAVSARFSNGETWYTRVD